MSISQSNFQFQNPFLTKLEYNINSIDKDQYDGINGIQTNIKIDDSKAEDNHALVALNLKIGTDTTAFKIDIEMQASFTWNDSFEKEQVNQLLNQNAPALLLSYMRPIISQITGYGFQSFVLPFIDFSKNGEREDR